MKSLRSGETMRHAANRECWYHRLISQAGDYPARVGKGGHVTSWMPPRPYVLAETNWKAVKDTPFEVAILPWGATEPHNYHLPYSTDNYETASIAERAAEIAWNQGARVVVLPTIPFGV